MNSRNDRQEKKDQQEGTANKGSYHKGAASISDKHTARHRKDNADGEKQNVSKKQGNSI